MSENQNYTLLTTEGTVLEIQEDEDLMKKGQIVQEGQLVQEETEEEEVVGIMGEDGVIQYIPADQIILQTEQQQNVV